MATKGSNEPLDIRDRGLTDVLGDTDALSLWELLRRAQAPTEAAALAEATGLRLEFVHDCLDRLAEAGLVERVKASSKHPTPRWRALREVIIVGYRVGDPVDEVLIGCVNDLFGPARRRLIRSHVLPADARSATNSSSRDRWSRTWAGRFHRAARRHFWELVPELSRLCHASTARFLGTAPSRVQMCTHVIEVRLEPLHRGVPRLPEIWMLPTDDRGRSGAEHASAARWLLGGPRPSAEPLGDLPLRPRQLDVARLVAAGASRAEAAARLGLSPGTVATHLRSVYRNLGVGSRAALRDRLRYAVLDGIVDGPRGERGSRQPLSPNAAVIDLRSPGVGDALSCADALATWEHLRRLDRGASAREIANTFEWDLARATGALDRLAGAGETLVTRSPAHGRGEVPRWHAAHATLELGHRVGDRRDEAMVAKLERIYREDRRKAVRGRAKSFEERDPDEELHRGTQAGAFTTDEVQRIFEILGRLESAFEAIHVDPAGEADASPWCDYGVSIDVEPLRPGILPQATMNVVGQSWATDLAKRLDDRVAALSSRERTVALQLREGRNRRQIAEALGISTNTVATLVKRLYVKLGVLSKTELAKRLGLRDETS